jgi:hypothetical protein
MKFTGLLPLLAFCIAATAAEPAKPAAHIDQQIEGWTVRVDERLLEGDLGVRALKSLESRLSNIKAVVPAARLEELQAFRIVLDQSHGKLTSMQYHPGARWLEDNGYAADLLRCVHLPIAASLLEPRQINVQPWVVLHELAHAYHDQVLGFDEPRILAAFTKYKESGRGEAALHIQGDRSRHYGLTDHKEFFAEMTEAYFGSNDFFPFNRGELKTAEPEIHQLMVEIWDPSAATR